MRRVLITGGAGFIGFHLAKKLLGQDFAVDLLDNFSRGVLDPDLEQLVVDPNVSLINCDLMQGASLSGLRDDYHHIYHLAAIIGVANVLERPYAVLHDNVVLLEKVIEFSRHQKNLARLIFTSTSEVYAGTLRYFDLPIPTPENTPMAITDLSHPRTSYMLSKIYGEALCHQSGVPFTIIRPHNFYGPRMGLSHVIPELLQRAHDANSGDTLDVYSVDHKRCFCYIGDAVEMMVRAAESDACNGETLNIGVQQPELTIGEVAKTVIKIVEKELSINTKPAAPGSPLRRSPDMNKTAKLTGYTAEVGLVEGIAHTYEWYRKNIFEGKGVSAK